MLAWARNPTYHLDAFINFFTKTFYKNSFPGVMGQALVLDAWQRQGSS